MTTFQFLHCADLHLDSPLRGLEADPDAPVEKIRGATRDALRNLVDFAIDQRLDFVVAAGDLYDGDWQDWRTGQFLIGQIARLTSANIPFIGIQGNHDAASVITRRLRMPEGARLLDHRRPETYRVPGLPVSIHGQSYATTAVTENIARAYPPPDPDRFNIGLLHSAVDGRDGHAPYAPCTIEELRAHGYQYWALGHVHKRRVLDENPWIVFCGNIQGRDVNETGAKGATLVTVTDGRIAGAPTPIPLDAVRWVRIAVVVAEDADEDTALSQVRAAFAEELQHAEGRLLAARVTLSGACLAHDSFVRDLGAARERIRAEAIAVAGLGPIWIETVEIRTTPPPGLSARGQRTDAIGQLIRALETTGDDAILEDVRMYSTAMLDKANPLRAALGTEHTAIKAADGVIPADLRQRAQDLLLGWLDE